MNIITIRDLIAAGCGALLYAVLSEIFRRLAMKIRRQRRKWYKASPEYRNRQDMLRKESREKMSRIMAETADPWAAPVKEVGRQ